MDCVGQGRVRVHLHPGAQKRVRILKKSSQYKRLYSSGYHLLLPDVRKGLESLKELYSSKSSQSWLKDECEGQPVAFAFWDSATNILPDVCLDGLRSAVLVGKFKVFLLVYKDIQGTELPCGAEILRAESLLEVRFYRSCEQCVFRA